MTANAELIEDLIRAGIPGTAVKAEPLRADGEASYAVRVVSPAFTGVHRLDRRRMIYSVLRNHIDLEATPLSIRALEK